MKTTVRVPLFAAFLLFLAPLSSCAQKEPVPAAPKKLARLEKPVVNASTQSIVYGKYGCTASKYRNGSYEYIPRGTFVLAKNGQYTYNGFEKPSTGTFTIDEKGNLLFKGGYFDGGKAEKMDRPNRYYIVFPSNPDNRWTCSLIEK